MIEKTDILIKYITEFIINNNKQYKSLGYTISIFDNYLYISYNNSIDYKVCIIEDNKKLFWYLTPFRGSYYTTLINDNNNSFDRVLYAIKEMEIQKDINN